MGERIGGFRSAAAEERFAAAYREAMAAGPRPVEQYDVRTSFGTARVYRYGPDEGAPIVLLHGFMSTSAGWGPFVGAFAERNPVYAVDALGEAGGSVQTRPLLSAADRARVLDEVLAGLGLSGVHVVGVSAGGWLGVSLVAHEPARVATLSLLEPTTVTSTYHPAVMWRAVLAAAIRSDRAMRWFLRHSFGHDVLDRPEVRVVLVGTRTYRMRLPMLLPPSEEQLRAVRIPVLAVFGARNAVHDATRAAARLRELVPHAEVDLWPDSGHDLGVFDDTGPITGRVLGFVRAHSG
ncbi:alpha/beta fold hydrolase [Umezawaea tangerina]|uniref:Pimeloyl-ACP methyl ester carboxylesterase n=1 Tax=Umezawaea tangerina TaxID=84725 RepID=A0A2T0T991_9PSEU|nr:alpha/beta hydrolase [Umezawaea tangerina]PRY42242.1 pimeloyl-ACP methyl ester carboxylesterase [Umezawaea tangerina]